MFYFFAHTHLKEPLKNDKYCLAGNPENVSDEEERDRRKVVSCSNKLRCAEKMCSIGTSNDPPGAGALIRDIKLEKRLKKNNFFVGFEAEVNWELARDCPICLTESALQLIEALIFRYVKAF